MTQREYASLDEYQSHKGQEVGVSDWTMVDQDRINAFADATGDHQWIHIDPDRCRKELNMPTIAHGFLTLSLLPELGSKAYRINGITRAINYGANKVRFTGMVPAGSKVRGRFLLKEMSKRGDAVQCISEATIEVEGQDRPAMVAETITLYYPS